MISGLQDIDRQNPTVSSGALLAVTPHDSLEIPQHSRGLYVGTGGDIRVTGSRDSVSVLLVGVLGGSVLPIRVKLVHATDTTAGDILALY